MNAYFHISPRKHTSQHKILELMALSSQDDSGEPDYLLSLAKASASVLPKPLLLALSREKDEGLVKNLGLWPH